MHSTLYFLILCKAHCDFVFLSPTHRSTEKVVFALAKTGPTRQLSPSPPSSFPSTSRARAVPGGARESRWRRHLGSPAELENDDGGGHGGTTALSTARWRRRPRHQGGIAEPPARAHAVAMAGRAPPAALPPPSPGFGGPPRRWKGPSSNGDVGSRSSVRFWITLVVGGVRHTDPASDPKTRIQQS